MNFRSVLTTTCAAVITTTAALLSFSTVAPAVTASSAGAPRVSPTATGDAWMFIRRACRTVAAGTACVNLEGNGQPSTYRVVYQLQPKPGQWMQPLTRATWFGMHALDSDELLGLQGTTFRTTRYVPFCSSRCAPVRQATNYVASSPYYAVYTMIFDTPQGHMDVSAGVTPTVSDYGSNTCLGGASITVGLTSTSDGTIYFYRQGRGEIEGYRFRSLSMYDDNARFALHTVRSSSQDLVVYTTPSYYAGWQRHPDGKGGWVTQASRSYMSAGEDASAGSDQPGTRPPGC